MSKKPDMTPEEVLEALGSDPYEDERRRTRYHARHDLGVDVRAESTRRIIVVERKRRKLIR